jgi:hypothetical protein
VRTQRFLAIAAALGLAGVAACSATPAPTQPNATPPVNLSCAWPSSAGVQSHNLLFSDSAAGYWLQPIVATATTTIHVSGRYPDARYFSLNVYTPNGDTVTGNGAGSSLPDYQIAADPGSVNPWQRAGTAGGSYELDLRADASGLPNVLPLPSGTTSAHPGYLLYRVYVPAGGDFSRIPLPSISISNGSTTTRLQPCATHIAPVWAPERSSASAPSAPATPPPPPDAFFTPAYTANGVGLLPNADASYVEAYFTRPAAGDVVVVTAKAPTFAPGEHPSPWPIPAEDMRYWSMCVAVGAAHVPTVINQLPGGKTDYGCRADESTAIGAAGNYTYVIGAESQRAEISAIPGATFLPLQTGSSATIYLLLLRNLLANARFTNSPQTVATTFDPAAASAAMGPYYPKVTTCALAALQKDGAAGCA